MEVWKNATRYTRIQIKHIRNFIPSDRIWVKREGSYSSLDLTVIEQSPDIQITRDKNGKEWLLNAGVVPGSEPRVIERKTGKTKGLIEAVISEVPRYVNPKNEEHLLDYTWENEENINTINNSK